MQMVFGICRLYYGIMPIFVLLPDKGFIAVPKGFYRNLAWSLSSRETGSFIARL